jgi:hypothetical protein
LVTSSENPPNHILVDLNIESQSDLLGDTRTAPLGFRCFSWTIAAMTSGLGPFGPGFFRSLSENSSRYLRFFSAGWRLKRVDGFNNDCGTDQSAGVHEESTQAGDERDRRRTNWVTGVGNDSGSGVAA